MSKIVNGWHAYSERKFDPETNICECKKLETWEHVLTCHQNQVLTSRFLGNIGIINLNHDVPAVCKTAIHKGLKQYLTDVHADYTAGEILYSIEQDKSGWKYLFCGLLDKIWVDETVKTSSIQQNIIREWCIEILQSCVSFHYESWIGYLQRKHGKTDTDKAAKKHKTLNSKIYQVFKNQPLVLQRDLQLFEQGCDDLIVASIAAKKAWLILVHNASLRYKKHQARQ